MEKILRNSVDLQSMYNGKSFNGDAHYFEDITTPASVRTYLDSFQVCYGWLVTGDFMALSRLLKHGTSLTVLPGG
jgi:hypothetical protein